MSAGTRTVDSLNGDAEASADARAAHLGEGDATAEFPVLSMTPPDPESVRVIGDVVLSRYVLRKHLGRGRYGETYEAVDRSFSDPQLRQEHAVALQLLSERVSCQTRVLEKLEASCHEPHLWSHPNIVKVCGFGCDRGQFFVVTELLCGLSLRSVLDGAPGEPLSDDETFAVIRGVGDALKYGHAKGAIHGGVRPENVFITEDRAVKVLDYLPATVPRTAPFFVEDAITIAAPEERDDVYCLACLAYELLTSRHPYNGNTPLEAWNAQLTLAPTARIGEHRWPALARALALRSENRTANVATFLADFGIKGYETLHAANDAAPVPEPTPSARQDDGVPVTGNDASAVHVAQRPPPPSEPAPIPQSVRPGKRAIAYFDDFDRLATRGDRRKPRRDHWRFTAVVALVAAIVGATFLYSEPLQRRAGQWFATARLYSEPLQQRAGQWFATARSYVDDIPRVTGELPAHSDDAAARIVAATQSDSPDGAEQPPADAASAPAEARQAADTPPSTARPDVASATPAPGPANASAAPADPSGPRTEPPARPAPEQIAARDARAPSIAEPEIIEFAARTVTVSEGQGVARVVIRRRGGALGESSIAWWADEGTASADDDYGNLGARIGRFAPGADTHVLYVPIANDSMPENRESFFVNVRASEGSGRGARPAQRIEIVITDDD